MEVKPVKIEKGMRVSELLEEFFFSAFNARRLSKAGKLWKEMISEKAFVILTIAGAMIPAGMREILKGMLERDFVHALVLTGANFVHEVCEALGYKHSIADEKISDVELAEMNLNRIYDVLINTPAFEAVENFLADVFRDLEGQKGSYEVLQEVGSKLENSFLRVANEKKVPVFCPTFHDSVAGLHFAIYAKKALLDYNRDIKKLIEICSHSAKIGITIIGGGVPKNFALQAMLLADGFDYAIQITTDSPHFGGLSGAELEEAKSWCKLKKDAKTATVYCDATIALPILYAYLLDSIT
ncbi:MAG: deoxyhypusine synthase [Archaeoglobaceae archaeon]